MSLSVTAGELMVDSQAAHEYIMRTTMWCVGGIALTGLVAIGACAVIHRALESPSKDPVE